MQDKENFYSQLHDVVDKILMGDFNEKVGSDNSDYEYVIERRGFGEMNENGELFAELCGNNDMMIGTWDGRSFLIDQLRIARIHRQEEILGRRFNTRPLGDAAVKRSFIDELENRAANIPEGGSVEDQWSTIKNAFIVSGESN